MLCESQMDSDGTKTFLTHGRWDVMDIVGYNEMNSTMQVDTCTRYHFLETSFVCQCALEI